MSTKRPLDLDRYQKRLTEMKTQLETDLQRFHSDEVLAGGGPEEPGPVQHWEHSGYGDHQADDDPKDATDQANTNEEQQEKAILFCNFFTIRAYAG